MELWAYFSFSYFYVVILSIALVIQFFLMCDESVIQ